MTPQIGQQYKHSSGVIVTIARSAEHHYGTLVTGSGIWWATSQSWLGEHPVSESELSALTEQNAQRKEG